MTIFLGFTTGLFLGALLVLIFSAYIGYREEHPKNLTEEVKNDAKILLQETEVK